MNGEETLPEDDGERVSDMMRTQPPQKRPSERRSGSTMWIDGGETEAQAFRRW